MFNYASYGIRPIELIDKDLIKTLELDNHFNLNIKNNYV